MHMLAYLDPASGSMIMSVIVGGAAGIAVFGKTLWAKMTSPFRRGTSPELIDDDVTSADVIDADLEID